VVQSSKFMPIFIMVAMARAVHSANAPEDFAFRFNRPS